MLEGRQRGFYSRPRERCATADGGARRFPFRIPRLGEPAATAFPAGPRQVHPALGSLYPRALKRSLTWKAERCLGKPLPTLQWQPPRCLRPPPTSRPISEPAAGLTSSLYRLCSFDQTRPDQTRPDHHTCPTEPNPSPRSPDTPQQWPLNALAPSSSTWLRAALSPRCTLLTPFLPSILLPVSPTLTYRAPQHLQECRRHRHHPRRPDTPDQGKEGRFQGHQPRVHGVRPSQGSARAEQPRPGSCRGYLPRKCACRQPMRPPQTAC
jgi:hypothetical protein